jgi:hypothetical protein
MSTPVVLLRTKRDHCLKSKGTIYKALNGKGPAPGHFGMGNQNSLLETILGNAAVKTVVERIIAVESSGDSSAKNKRSSATGAGQFLDETWLELIERTDQITSARVTICCRSVGSGVTMNTMSKPGFFDGRARLAAGSNDCRGADRAVR